jgi:hypothetical protein
MSRFWLDLSPPKSMTMLALPQRVKYSLYPGPRSTLISETLPPTGCQSPRFPSSAKRIRAAIRTCARRSGRSSSQAWNSKVWRTVYTLEVYPDGYKCQASLNV